jgi:SAM-dependent methyltransferase
MSRGHFIGLNHHRVMLADGVRMQAYQQAIQAQVRPGMRVLDLGTGSGILALWAARAGAEVVAVEPNDVIHVAEKLARANGLADRIRFAQADARTLTLDRPVDLVVSECMGNFFVTDEMQPVLRDLPRLMAPGAVTIPRSIGLWLAAAELPLWHELSFWEEPVGGLDYSCAVPFASQHAYVLQCEPEFLLTAPARAGGFPLVQSPDAFTLEARLPFTAARTLHGLVGWFEADLGAGVSLSTAPGIRTHWGQMVFPLPAVHVTSRDSLEVRLSYSMDADYRGEFTWEGWVRLPGREDVWFSRDTRQRFTGGIDERS